MDWKDVILSYYGILQIAIQAVKALGKLKKVVPTEFSVEELREGIQNGDLHFGDKVRILGTFSEYLPFVDPKFLLKESKSFPRILPRTTRIAAIDDLYCGALFKLDQTDAFAEEVLPIFYGLDSKMLEHTTGEMLEMQCRITQVPIQYRNIINQNDYFVFEKEEGLVVPFGLKVEDVKPYGILDSFKISTWLIGSLNPPLAIKESTLKKTCINCGKNFCYFPIDPFDFPPRYGCIDYREHYGEMSREVVAQTERFLNLEREGTPYVVFPDPFKLFEVFNPAVDIFNRAQRQHSKNIMIGAVQRNMKELIKKAPFPFGLPLPRQMAVSVDFSYDQVNKMTQQTFDPADVPKWQCPHFKPIETKTAKRGKSEKAHAK